MFYICTKCENEQENRTQCNVCEEKRLYIINEYPQDIKDAPTGRLYAGLWGERDIVKDEK